MAAAKQLNDIAECPICIEEFTDPRVLPCVHTFCLKCIETYIKEKSAEKMVCPMCRTKFTLPCNGVADLPKNYFVNDFLQMKEMSHVESKANPCEACSCEDGNGSAVRNAASVYCVECQMKLCQICERGHKAIKLTSSHTLLKVGEKISVEPPIQSLPPGACDRHVDKNIEIYCCDCKSAICMMCYIDRHNGHKCADLNKVEGDFCKRMGSDVAQVTIGAKKCSKMLLDLDKEKNEFIEKVAKTGKEIGEKAEQLRRMIDRHEEKLMNELSSIQEKRTDKIENLREEIERRMVSMESYSQYVDDLRQKATACDIIRAANGLHDTAEELLDLDAIELSLTDLCFNDVTFTSSDYVVDDVSKTLGHASFNVVVEGRDSVAAVAMLRDEVCVLRCNCPHVEVYDAVTLKREREIAIPWFGAWSPVRRKPCNWLCGLAACPSNDCLYASDWNNSCVHKIELADSSAVKKWSVPSYPVGLSVNRAHNLVVACSGWNQLQEYTTHGCLVREIRLQAAGALWPWHAVQLSSGDYAMSQFTTPGVVSVVGVVGGVVSSYRQTSGGRQMRHPRGVAVTKNGHILVADCDNDRIVLIWRSTGCVEDLELPVGVGLQRPSGLCLDESRGRLYVAELGGRSRVLVFDGVYL